MATSQKRPRANQLAHILSDLRKLAVPIESLNPDPENTRRHSESDLNVIKSSLDELGQHRPLVVQKEGRIIRVGNGTWTAAKELGWKWIAAVVVDEDRMTATRRSILDNRTAELSEWDTDQLVKRLDEAKEDDWELEDFGWDDEELARLTASEVEDEEVDFEEVVEDEVPEPPKKAVSKLGDVWKLGDHILVCGDSRDSQSYSSFDSSFHMVLTDPPYGVGYVGGTGLTIQNDTEDGLEEMLTNVFGNVLEKCEKGSMWYVFGPPGPLGIIFGRVLLSFGVLRQILIWVKDRLVLGRSHFHYRNEPIFYGWSGTSSRHPPPNRKQDSVWEFDRPHANKEHPTMKPLNLLQHAIVMGSSKGDFIVDPFSGSGSTLIASEATERICCSVEIDPRYSDVIIERWENFTGKKAKRIKKG